MHSVEGGGIFTPHNHLYKEITLKRNFGHDGIGKFAGVGINGKNS